MKPFNLSDLPPALQAQALAQLGATASGGMVRVSATSANGKSLTLADPRCEPKTIDEARDRLRQKKAPMNKTEAAFFEYLQTHEGPSSVLPQALTLRLGNGVRYTPDFIVASVTGFDGETKLSAYEVKGYMREDAAVKLKVAAAAYPWITFYLVTAAKGGPWNIQCILP